MKSLIVVALAACIQAKEKLIVSEDGFKREHPIVEGPACK
jgi:hypothetical protein